MDAGARCAVVIVQRDRECTLKPKGFEAEQSSARRGIQSPPKLLLVRRGVTCFMRQGPGLTDDRPPASKSIPAAVPSSTARPRRESSKAGSSSDDSAPPPAGPGAREGALSRHGDARRASSAQRSATSEPTTVGEVLRTAKAWLQPTNAVERQFYADCYRACQVTANVPRTSSGGDAPSTGTPTGPTPPAPAPQPAQSYLSSVPEVALRLSCLGHRVVVRRVTDSKHYWSKSMTNVFCYSVLPGTGIGYVVDPCFKEHFRAGLMSERYRDIWECMPPIFVGPPAKLVQLVQALCAELGASFEAQGRQLPPWRTFAASINRWMSPAFRDLPVPPRRPPPPGAAAGTAGSIPAAEAQAFLRSCEDLLTGTASAGSSGSGGGGAGVSGSSAAASVGSGSAQPASGGAGAGAACDAAAGHAAAAAADGREPRFQTQSGFALPRAAVPRAPATALTIAHAGGGAGGSAAGVSSGGGQARATAAPGVARPPTAAEARMAGHAPSTHADPGVVPAAAHAGIPSSPALAAPPTAEAIAAAASGPGPPAAPPAPAGGGRREGLLARSFRTMQLSQTSPPLSSPSPPQPPGTERQSSIGSSRSSKSTQP